MKNSWQFIRSAVLALSLATGVLAAVLGCRRTEKPPAVAHPHETDVSDTLPCPHYWSHYFNNRGVDTALFLAGDQIDVPEYNDCQRLLVDSSSKPDPAYTQLKFDSVAAIWAREKLDTVYRNERPIGTATSRSFFAKLVNPHPTTTRLTSIGVIWTPGNYAPLGLTAKFSCIVLQWDGPVGSRNPPNYHAWMVHVTEQKSCASPLDLPPSSAFPLGVLELTAQQNADGPDDIPPVARWDWDARRGEQYVGVACPSGWCELYGKTPNKPLGHWGSTNYHVPGGLNIHGHDGRVVRQKGWYDEEYLASTTTTPGKVPELDGVGAFGTVFPVPQLKGRQMQDYHAGTFVPVAWVSINRPSTGYANKYGFKLDAAPPQSPDVNALFLCYDDGITKCDVHLKYTCTPQHDHADGPSFYARLGSSPTDRNGTDFCVDFIGTTPGVPSPGTVRWRWLDDDQTIWVSCPSGCCQISKPK